MKMKTMSLSVCLLAMMGTAKSWADTPCADAGSTMEMLQCLSGEFDKADAELNKVYFQKKAIFQNETDPAIRKELNSRLQKAQRAWIGFRDAECLLQSMDNLGGSLERVENLGCRVEMTKERVQVLKNVSN